MRSVVILSAVAATLAASVSYASETLACSGNDCCSLNGEYAGTSCTCYPPWTGPACATLDVAPVQAPYQGYGMSPNVTSWGGNVIEVGGVYHMYVAEMVNNCSLNAWGSNSRCSHAVSSSIEGPYVYVAPAVDVWCHNPQVIATQNASGPLYVLFHIGSGAGGNPKNCNVSRADVDGPSGWAGDAPQAATARSMRGVAGGDAAGGSSLHVATSPYGPWVPVQPAPPSCNNPAPFLHPNGTWYLVCSGFTMYSSPSITGPWATVLKNINPAGKGVGGTYEDPFLYVDARGNWHLLFHVYTLDVPATCVNSTVSGHWFSPDGLSWTASPTAPFGNNVAFTDGSAMTVATRERPKLLFNSAGEPTHLVNGVTGGASHCAPTPCVNCKYNYWDFTLVQPLNA